MGSKIQLVFQMFTLNCRGKIMIFEKPVVMGIVNVTPDSFYQGNSNQDNDTVLKLAEKMIGEGALILDIGGQSTRPGSERISAEVELQRVIPVIRLIRKKFRETLLSIDTYHSEVAVEAVKEGVSIINDISAAEMDEKMLTTAAALHTPYICMHMKGTPETMQHDAHYSDVTTELIGFFSRKIVQCKEAGIHDIVIDPGFGFGKTIQHNFQLLKELSLFKIFDVPILAGLSRKATVYKTLGITADQALNGTTVLNTIALQNAANILRVHDVKEAVEAVELFGAYSK